MDSATSSGGSNVHGSVDRYLHDYRLLKTLGFGSFGKVIEADDVITRHKVAIKKMKKKKIWEQDAQERVRREIKIMRLLMHPNIIRLYQVIETQRCIYLVMEIANNGALYDYLSEKGRLNEDEARHFFRQIISGLEHCHQNMVVHRDLKPENLLLDKDYNLKIADFGLSNIMCVGCLLKSRCGSPNYAAPEVISGKSYVGPPVDVWSCGVILYALLFGCLPFDDENIPNLLRKVKDGIYTFPNSSYADARHLISCMLLVDPSKRVTIPEIKQHPWFQFGLPLYSAVPLLDTNQQEMEADMPQCNAVDQTETSSTWMHENTGVGSNSHQNQAERKWELGLQSRKHPSEIMLHVVKTLQELAVCWKKIGKYGMKCRWLAPLPTGKLDQSTSHDIPDNQMALRSFERNSFSDAEMDPGKQRDDCDVVKFEMQLYKTEEDNYLLDLKRVQGPHLLYLDLCASFLSALHVL